MNRLIREVVKSTHRSRSFKVLSNCQNTSSSDPSSPPRSASAPPKSTGARVTVNVPGLSKKVLNVPTSEVGPGASKKANYKNPEYYCYNNTSYFEAEVEMLKYRLPQPSNKASVKK